MLYLVILVLLHVSLVVYGVPQNLTTGEDVATFVQSKINHNQVMVFAKSYCPFCKMTRSLLEGLQDTIYVGVEFLDLDKLPGSDGALIQGHLYEKTGQKTVPNIFIGQEHVGGNSDIQQLFAMGKLEVMLLQAEEAGPEL